MHTLKLFTLKLSINVNNLSVCIGWCADQVTLRGAQCNDKDVHYSVHENPSNIPSQSHKNSIHTLSNYLISVLILSFYPNIGILKVFSLEVIDEGLVCIFILKAFQYVNCNYF